MSVSPDAKSIMPELERIAQSPHFVRSKRLIRFLQFTVAETLRGRGDALSEHVIATEAYERPATFDPHLDPIIRNEARRLRSKLNHYYRTEGSPDPIIIKYRPGSYAPTFHFRGAWQALDLLAQAGKLGALIADFDWKKTSLGPIATWPANLRLTLDICLRSKVPMAILWGQEMLVLYNDANAAILGNLHPAALGRQASLGLGLWDQIGPNLLHVIRTGESIEVVDGRLIINRRGYDEECYFTCSCSAILDENGIPAGVLVVSSETTERIVSERRRSVLWELSQRELEADTTEQVCRTAANILSTNSRDVPFAWVYRMEKPAQFRLEAGAGDPSLSPLCPFLLDLSDSSLLSKAVGTLVKDMSRMLEGEIVDLQPKMAALPGRARLTPRTAMVFAIPAWDKSVFGLLVVAISQREMVDASYRGFLTQAAAHIRDAVRNAHEHEEERRRAAALALSDQWKARLLARVGASLRSPLDSVVTTLDLMLAETKTLQDRADRQQLEGAHSNSLILLKIERSLLLLSDLETISGDVSFQPTDLATVTSEVAALFRPAIEKAGLQLKEELAPAREPVCLNRDMWGIVVANLLSNALKFTDKGTIGVAVRQNGALAEIVIWDTGEGIPSEDIPHVFDRLFRAEIKGARSFAGLGLGLALVRDLLGLHDATIGVDSKLHSGTTFRITMPVHRRPGTGTGLATTPTVLRKWPSAQLYVQEALQWPGFTRP